MAPKAHGRILFWEGASLWLLRAPPGVRYPKTEAHAHHVVQLTLALRGRVDFDGPSGRVGGVAVAIAPDAPHAFEADGLIAHLFVASDGRLGRALVRRLFARGPVVSFSPDRLGGLPSRLRAAFEAPRQDDDALRALGQELLALLAGPPDEAPVPDARVEHLITWVTARLDEPVRLAEVAALVGLSPGRTRHLFVQQTGLPFKTFVLWLRLMRAVEFFATGASLTDAAHGAGFADSSHLSRTFRRMFGITAASLQVEPPRLSAPPASGPRRRP